jgi:putative adhesin
MTSTVGTSAELQHPIGRNGRFALRMPSGTVSIEAVDGNIARVRDLSGRPLADRFQITTGSDSLELVVRTRFNITFQIGNLGNGGPSAELIVELPRGTRVAVDTASADVSATGLTGPGRYRTASGDLIIQDAGGNLEIEAVSADVRVEAIAPIEIVGRTISGDAVIRAPRLNRFEMNTTSGDIRVDADLSGKGPYAIKSISGDVTLVARGGIQVDASTVTGDLESAVPHRNESGPGRKVLIVGKPTATLTFKSVSGDLSIVEPRDAAMPMPPLAPAAPDAPVPPDAPLPAFADEDADADDDDDDDGDAETERLEVLRALERGEIDVATAMSRLAAVEGA